MFSELFGLLLALLAYPLIGFVSYSWLRSGNTLRLKVSAAGLSALVASIPFWLAGQAPIVRFTLALASLVAIVRIWETATRAPADPAAFANPKNYATFFSSVGDVRYSEDPAASTRARREGQSRAVRAVLKFVALAALIALYFAYPRLLDLAALGTVWCLLAAFCSATGAADLLTAATMLVSGQRVEEVFRSPLLSRSPMEFWSQRWNLLFRNSAFRLIFIPWGGRRRPMLCTAIVFLWSALVHEYMVVAALGTSRGHMFAFFTLHGAATLLGLSFRGRGRLPRALGIALHWAWMIVTGPLFFAPILQILRVRDWIAW